MGDRQRADGLRRLPDRLQHVGHGARGPAPSASSPATTPRSTRAGSATAAASRATSRSPTASPRRSCAASAGSTPVSWDEPRDDRAARCATSTRLHGAGLGRHRHRRRPHQRGGLRLGAASRASCGAVTASGPVRRGRRLGAARPLRGPHRRPRPRRPDRGRRRRARSRTAPACVDLRVRKARRRGAHLLSSAPAARARARRRLRRAQPGSTRRAAAQALRRPRPRPRRALAAAERPVLIVTDGVDLAAIAALPRTRSACTSGGGVLPLPTGAERARRAPAAASAGGGDEVLAAIEAGDRAGAGAARRRPDRPSGRTPIAGRWRCRAGERVLVTARRS